MIVATDWVAVSSIVTAAATLVLAVATFASVRSANRAARAAERSLLAGLRPLLAPSRFDDPPQKVGFADNRWFKLEGGSAIAEVGDEAIYLLISLRNVGSGIAVLHGWSFHPDPQIGAGDRPDPDAFRRLTRDIYVAPGEVGFWQGAFRDRENDDFSAARRAIEARQRMAVEILYGDHELGQRSITRFGLTPREDGDGWLASVARHWNVDRPDPR
ncbi:MAG TPA: hypothetical protein VE982_02405 [Gaiellaceae bacterium]|nr:hypothetical protein [Gaiellaceae bacterium]